MSCPISSSSLPGWQRDVPHPRLPWPQGSPAPFRRDDPPHGPQSRPMGEVLCCRPRSAAVGTVKRRTLEAPAPAHRRFVNPPLLVHPRFRERHLRCEIEFLQEHRYGGDGPGPSEFSAFDLTKSSRQSPSTSTRRLLGTGSWCFAAPSSRPALGMHTPRLRTRGGPPEREYEELPYDACAPKPARRQQQRLKQPGRRNREASWAPFASAFGKPHHRDSAEFSTPLPRLFSTNSLRELWQAPCFWEFYTCQVSLRGIGRFLAATST